MKTLQIEIPDGYEINGFDIKSGKVTLKPVPKKVTERIKTISDVVMDNGWDSLEHFNQSYSNLEKDERAHLLLKMIAKSLNEGWRPNWDNSNEYKYYPYFDMRSGFRFDDAYDHWASGSNVGSRLCFKTRELAEYAGKTFESTYKDYFTF